MIKIEAGIEHLKKKIKKQPVALGETALRKNAIRRVFLIIIAGMLLIAVDFIAAADSDVDIIKKDGKLYMVRPEEGGSVGYITFMVKVKGEGKTEDQKVEVALEPYSEAEEKEEKEDSEDGSEISESERIGYEVRKITGSFNDDSTAKLIELPTQLESGEKVEWERQRETNSIVIAAVMIFLIFAVCRSYMKPLERKRKEEMESVTRNLPEFVNKIVLLLNAGLVLNSAFETAISESLQFRGTEDDYFCGKLEEIHIAVTTTNSSVNEELRKFAKESGSKELMRISNIISDNVNKGVELTEKLQRESESLWINRKKTCEEKGRLAETKLTLPLMIFLMVLIVITIAPALMEL